AYHGPWNIRLSINFLGIEVLVQKVAKLSDGAIDLGLLGAAQSRVGHCPIGDEISQEQSLGEAKFLVSAEEELFGLLNFLLSLNVGLAKCHKVRGSNRSRRGADEATHCSKERALVHP